MLMMLAVAQNIGICAKRFIKRAGNGTGVQNCCQFRFSFTGQLKQIRSIITLFFFCHDFDFDIWTEWELVVGGSMRNAPTAASNTKIAYIQCTTQSSQALSQPITPFCRFTGIFLCLVF